MSLVASAPARSDESTPTSFDASRAAEPYLERVRDVIFYALSMVGIKYRWGGDSPQVGFDCAGLVRHVYEQVLGLALPRDAYSLATIGDKVSVAELRPGDLVFYNTLRRPFSHVGIYLGEQRFVHAPSSGKTVHIVDMTNPYWAKRFNGARRLPVAQ